MTTGPHDNSQALKLAFSHSRAGRNRQAAEICRQILKTDPGNGGANYLLGFTLSLEGQHDEAIRLLQRAVACEPGNPWGHIGLGNALKQKGNLADAIPCYEKAISLAPGNPEAYFNLANTHKQLGNLRKAADIYRSAISHCSDFPWAYNNLANILQEQGLLAEAAAHYRKAIDLVPDRAELHHNLANVYYQLGQYQETIACDMKALELNPRYAEACNGLGQALLNTGRISEAIRYLAKALQINPVFANALNNLGNAYRDKGELDLAKECYEKALQADTGYHAAHSNLIFLLNYQDSVSQKDIYNESLLFARRHVQGAGPDHPSFAADHAQHDKLKIGYISPDFRTHSVAYFFEPLLKAHNRGKFEIFCYSDVRHPDHVTERIAAAADHWQPIAGREDAEVAELITRDNIDILVDLAGHTGNNRLLVFGRCPAPVQVTWLGYPNTTGLKEIDYRFTDDIADPPGKEDTLYSEQLFRLEHGFLCYEPPGNGPEVSQAPSLGNGYITFGSFNNATKIIPAVVKTWASILNKVPGSRLVLKAKQLADEGTRNRYLEMFTREGVPAERITLRGMLPDLAAHLQLYNSIDISLDTFPYNGTTTTCESLWMGVPVVTLLGDRHSSRVGAGILSRLGLSSLIAEDSDAYLETAVSLAGNRQELTDLRKSLRSRMRNSPLCDAHSFARQIEDAFQVMWQNRGSD